MNTDIQTTPQEAENEAIEKRRNEQQTTSKNNEQKASTDNDNERMEGQELSESRSVSVDDDNSSIFSVPKRYVLAIMMFIGFMNMYAIRVNLNVAIGAMVKPHPVVEKGRHYIKVINLS